MGKGKKRPAADSESPIAEKKRKGGDEKIKDGEVNKSILKSGDQAKIAAFHARRKAIAFLKLKGNLFVSKFDLNRAEGLSEKPRLFLTLNKLIELYKRKVSKVPGHTQESLETFPPLFAQDVLFLILQAISGNNSSYYPRWCKLMRPSKIASLIVLVIDGVSYEDVKKNQDSFSYLNTNLPLNIQMISPLTNEGSFERELFWVHMSETQGRTFLKSQSKYEKKPVIEKGVEISKFSECVPVDTVDKFDRRLLLLNVKDMVEAGIPLPVTKDDAYKYYSYSKETYDKVKSNSPIFAIDCEMCKSRVGMELTRIAVVNEKCEVLIDHLVKPRNAIIDYVTRFSGITSEMLSNVQRSLGDVQKLLRSILPPDAILVGHSIETDLKALKLFHPYIIDTSIIYNLGQVHLRDSLKSLSRHFLKKNIQIDVKGHSPAEDAIATMELVLLKLRTGIHFGDFSVGCPVARSHWQTPSSHLLNNKSSKVVSDGKSLFYNTALDLQYKSLFEIVRGQGISSVVIGKPESLPEGTGRKTKVKAADNDVKCAEIAEKEMKQTQFVWLKLDDCVREKKRLKNKDYKKEKFQSLDDSIKNLVEQCEPGSLFITLFSGRKKKGTLQSAGAFVCIPGNVDFMERNDGRQLDNYFKVNQT